MTDIAINFRITPRGARRPRQSLLATIAGAALVCAAVPAAAYTPQVYDSTKDVGQDFTKVPANTAWNASNGINQKIWNNIWGNQFYFAGSSGLWITSAASKGWPTTGMLQLPSSCSAGEGYGNFHYRAAMGSPNQGPGANLVLWPADNDPGWPGIIKNSDDNHIGEIDVVETGYGSNDVAYSTFHFYNGAVSGHNGSITHAPDSFLTGDMTSMHDYDVVWGPGSLVIKIDGVVQMSAPPTQVRPDFAHGGCNVSLGAQMAMQATAYDHTPTDWIEIQNMWWSASDGSAGSGTSTPISGSGSGSSSTPVVDTLLLATPAGVVSGTAGSLTVTASYSIGATVSEVINGTSTTVATTRTATGFTVPYPASIPAGSDTIKIVDGTNAASNTVTLAVAAAPVVPPPVTPTPPTAPVSNTKLSLTGITIKGNYAYLIGSKQVGAKTTLREYVDGAYKGTLWDGMPDGAFDFQSIMLPSGTHKLMLALDGLAADNVTVTYTLSGTTVTLAP